MNKPEDFITGANKLINWLGYFPMFHDSEVLTVTMERQSPSIVMGIHAWRVTREVENGEAKLDKHAIVKLKWDKVSRVELHGFNDVNILSDLQFFLNPDRSIRTRIGTSHGLYGEIVSATVHVLNILPIDPKSYNGIRSVYRT